MNTRTLLTAVISSALLMAGCSSPAETDEALQNDSTAAIAEAPQNDWIDRDQKLAVFMEHVCWRDGHQSTLDPYTQAVSVAVGVLADPASTPEDKKIALSITIRPADAYEQDVARAEAAAADGEYIPVDTVPRTLTPEVGTCSGWVWEKHLEQVYAEEYDDFTFEEARRVKAI